MIRGTKTLVVIAAMSITTIAHAGDVTEAQTELPSAYSLSSLPWQVEGRGPVGGVASLAVTQDVRYLPAAPASQFLSMMGNPPVTGFRVVAPPDLGWYAVYAYEPVGHVDDADDLDPDAIMTALRADETRSNEDRRARGLPELHIVGWEQEPMYDASRKRLEWGLRISSQDGQAILNRTVRMLGREGYVSGTLVIREGLTTPALIAFDRVNASIEFHTGAKYQEFRQGDRISEYGLTALVTGGIGAAAIKTGAARNLFGVVAGGVEGAAAGLVAAGSALAGAFAAMTRRIAAGGTRGRRQARPDRTCWLRRESSTS